MDHVFGVLNHPRRRYVLYALSSGNECTLGELALRIAAWERDVEEHDVDDEKRDHVSLSLYHAHVPMLEDEGVVEYDRSEETLRLGTHAEQALAVLESASGAADVSQRAHAEADVDGPVDD